MVLMLFRKHLVNGKWTTQKRFKPQFVTPEQLKSIVKREENKHPGYRVMFEYYTLEDDEVSTFKEKHIKLELQK